MIPFTLYCFAEVFDLSYSGPTSRLNNFFREEKSAGALEKVVTANTRGRTYAERIDVNSPRAVNALKSISMEHLRFVYQNIIKEDPEGKSKAELILPLLEHAVLQDRKIQADVYTRRESDEVQDFINRLQNISLQPDVPADCAEPESSRDAHAVLSPTDSDDTVRVEDEGFLHFIEEHIDKVSSFLICCHISANWLKPSSPRFHLLRALCERNVQVRVIMNTSEAIREIYPHMVDREAYEMKMYQTIDHVAETWKAFSASKPSLTVKRSALPILHTLTVCEFQDDLQPIMRTTLYAYGNPLLEDHPHLVFHKDDAYYNVLRNEFEYLWEHAELIDE